MNWYPKLWLGVLFAISFNFLSSCVSPSDVGKQLQQGNSLGGLTLTDTLSINTSNMLLDSLCEDPIMYFYNNYGASAYTRFNILVGNYSNPNFGSVTCSTYVQFVPYSTIPTKFDNTYVCDSVVLSLIYNSYYANGFYPYNIYNSGAGKYYAEYTYGDTTQPHNLIFYEASQNLSATVTEPTTKSPISVNPTSLGNTGDFIPSPFVATANSMNFVRVKISNSLGTKLVNAIASNSADVSSNFSNYFNGLVIVPDPKNTAVLGFVGEDVNYLQMPLISVYYHNQSRTDSGIVSFVGKYKGVRYNNITSNRSTSTYLNALQNPYDSISTSLTGNLCFIQAGSGLGVKVTLPSIVSFANSLGGKLDVSNAYLVIKRSSIYNIDNGGPDHKLPPPYLTLYALGDNGKPYKFSTSNQWQTITTDRTSGNPIRALYDYASGTYTIDVTNYIQNQLLLKKKPQFILTAGYNDQLVNGLVFGDFNSNDSPIRLKLYYSQIKN